MVLTDLITKINCGTINMTFNLHIENTVPASACIQVAEKDVNKS